MPAIKLRVPNAIITCLLLFPIPNGLAAESGPSIHALLVGGFVNSEVLAIELAKTYLKHHYGQQGLSEQQPLTATEQDGLWYIHGAKNNPDRPEDVGPAIIKINRTDGRVVELVRPRYIQPLPEVDEIIRQFQKKN